MTITLADLRQGVRDLYQNMGANTISDDTLDRCISNGLWRLSEDRPNEVEYQLNSTGQRFSISSLITDWVKDFSTIRQVWKPIPTTSLLNSNPLTLEEWRLLSIGSTDYLYVNQGVDSGGLLVIYTIPWRLEDIGGATATTIPETMEYALLNICACKAGLSMAAKSAGSSDKSMPADFVNIGSSKSDQYRRVAREFEKDYLSALKLSYEHPKGISVTRGYEAAASDGTAYMTHRSLTGGIQRW